MLRTFFNQFDIDDQDHELLTSKKFFIETFQKEIVSLNSYKWVQTTNESTNAAGLLKIHANFDNFKNQDIEKKISIYYTTQNLNSHRRMMIYEIDLINDTLEYDADDIFLSIFRFLKRKKICYGYDVFHFDKNVISDVKKIETTHHLRIDVENNRETLELMWDIINVIEKDFLRIIDKKDFN